MSAPPLECDLAALDMPAVRQLVFAVERELRLRPELLDDPDVRFALGLAWLHLNARTHGLLIPDGADARATA